MIYINCLYKKIILNIFIPVNLKKIIKQGNFYLDDPFFL